MKYLRKWGVLSAALMALPVLCGCGGSEGRVPVTGTVTIDGQPMEKGSISFIGADGTAAASGNIVGGKYKLREVAGAGTQPGKYGIQIESWKEEPGTVLPNGNFAKGVSAIPERYQHFQKSELQAEVTPQKHAFDFDVKSK